MKYGQTMKNPQGIEIALFPMTHLNITQGRYNKFSHKGYNATDLAGKDTGIDDFIAPFSCRVLWKDPVQNTGVGLTNQFKVQLANGRIVQPGELFILLWHDNWIGDLWVGQLIPQGKVFYQEGTKGYATGNHVHVELSYWKYDGRYPIYQLANGYWTTHGVELNIEDAFYVNDTIIINSGGYTFKRYLPQKSTEEIAKEVIANKWGVGQDRVNRLTKAGYDPVVVQKTVNALLAVNRKSVQQIAQEVIEGKWGVGSDRANRLTNAGYNYNVVQTEVNRIIADKDVPRVAKEVIAGKWGVGSDRKARLTKAGYNYNLIQAEVNRQLRG